jgi:hypothetical protein
MSNGMGSTVKVAVAQHTEAMRLEARARFENGVVYGEDEQRAAELGKLHELPSLADALGAWMRQISSEHCEDYAVNFRDVLLAPDGRLDMGEPNLDLAHAHGSDMLNGQTRRLPMTYRSFGSLLRDYTSPERNVARNFIRLPRAQDPVAHTGRTMRALEANGSQYTDGAHVPAMVDSPRAIAFNAMLDERKRSDQRVTSITGESVQTTVIFRSRLFNRRDENGALVSSPRTIFGVVSPTHSLRDGDDDKLIAALSLAFAGHLSTARGAAYRGVEESELRAVFPALEVSIPGTGTERWSGYITARNSESGAKSWSISGGLYRQADGASVACEAVVRTGRHVGSKVAERMVEVAEGAAALLKTLVEKAGELAGRAWEGTDAQLLRKLREALSGTAIGDADTLCGIAWGLGAGLASGIGEVITLGTIINLLGGMAGALPRRVDARPIEVMLGRTLVSGWSEFKSAATEEVTEEE